MSGENEGAGVLAGLSEQLAGVVERAGQSVARVRARRGQGASGIVWSSDGRILTADHVLEREEEIGVELADGRALVASLVARDPGTDLALLRVDATGLSAATLGEDGAVRVGHLALALGRPGPGGLMASLGVIGALGGPWRTARGGQVAAFVRSDATLYPGFSGGPLIDARGRVVAVNSWTLSQGAGLALPVGVAARIAGALATGGVKRAYLGVGTQAVALPGGVRERLGGQEQGLLLITVEAGGPAERSGLLVGDILVALDDLALTGTGDLQAALTPERAGQTAPVKLVRGGEVRELAVQVGVRS